MVRNRCGYWMSPKFFMSPDSGGGAGGDAGAPAGGEGAETSGATIDASKVTAEANNSTNNTPESVRADDNTSDTKDAEIARLKALIADQKSAIDKATKEAGDLRKEMRSKMTQAEIEATEKKEAEEKAAKELDELRRKVARSEATKTVMGKLGLDEESAGNLADHLYGAADIDNALLEIQKAWQSREKALRMEFGKLTGPGTGADSNSPEAAAIRRASELGKARNTQNEQAQKAMNAYIR